MKEIVHWFYGEYKNLNMGNALIKSRWDVTNICTNFLGSGALSGLMLDLGLLKIILGEFFSYF